MKVRDLIEELHKFGMNDEVIVPAQDVREEGLLSMLTNKIVIDSAVFTHKRYVTLIPGEGKWKDGKWEIVD